MSIEQALTLMKTSKNVTEWNDNRDFIKDTCFAEEWKKIFPEIDGRGLIVKVLGRDIKRRRYEKA